MCSCFRLGTAMTYPEMASPWSNTPPHAVACKAPLAGSHGCKHKLPCLPLKELSLDYSLGISKQVDNGGTSASSGKTA